MEKKERIFIYRIYFPANGKCYIGQTTNLEQRMRKHLLYSKSAVHSALWKYDNWKISVLHICKTRDEANRIEIEEIRNFDSVAPNGYNISHGGDGGDTFTDNPNKEQILVNMSRASKGRKPSVETKQKMRLAAIGRVISQEQREKLRQANLGKKHSEETKRKLKEWRETHKNPCCGMKHTDETKAKVFATKRANTVAKTIGKTFGRLKAIEYLSEIPGNRDWYRCVCICGKEKHVCGARLRQGKTKSCGCMSAMKRPEIVAKVRMTKAINNIKKVETELKEELGDNFDSIMNLITIKAAQ